MYDLVAIGESLIDFTPMGVDDRGVQLFGCNSGGAPANVLAMHAKLGGRNAFIGQVGKDAFGDFLRANMEKAGIGTIGMRQTPWYPTTLAFVHLSGKGERSFSFYRKESADVMLRAEDVDMTLVQNCAIFHFGSVSMTAEPSRSATLASVQEAKAAGAIISYDPNYRPFLWKREQDAIEQMESSLAQADLVKVSEDEMQMLTGCNEPSEGAHKLMGNNTLLVVVTLGEKGAYYQTHDFSGMVSTYDVQTVDTTGAGDAFWGTLLYRLKGLSKENISMLKNVQWQEIIAFANAAGSLTTTMHGAIPAMPSIEQIFEVQKTNLIK